MKAILGGKDAQGAENSRAYDPDFEIASNNFKIFNGLVLAFGGGRRNSPLSFARKPNDYYSPHGRLFFVLMF